MVIAVLQLIVLLSVTVQSSRSLNLQNRTTPIGVGDTAPDFTLEDQNKNKVMLSDARGKSHVVLVFYRGYW